MIPSTPEFILLIITLFHNGDLVYAPMPDRMTESTCEKEAAEKQTGWELDGDRDTFRFIKYKCMKVTR